MDFNCTTLERPCQKGYRACSDDYSDCNVWISCSYASYWIARFAVDPALPAPLPEKLNPTLGVFAPIATGQHDLFL